jgi:uncharacterized protein
MLAAATYLIAIGVLGSWALGWLFPPLGVGGLWFYSAAAALVLGEFIVEPFFTRPADALANGSALLLTVVAVSPSGASVNSRWIHFGRIVFLAYAVAVLIFGIAAIWLKDATGVHARYGRFAYVASGTLGRARWIFGALYFAAVYAVFSDSAGRVAVMYLAWIVVFSLHPLERTLQIDRRRPGRVGGQGQVIALEDPRVVVAGAPPGVFPTLGTAARVGAVHGRVVDQSTVVERAIVRISLDQPSRVADTDSIAFLNEVDTAIVGHVSPGTTIDELVVQTAPTPTTLALEEAELVQAPLGEHNVLFQVTSASVRPRSDAIGEGDMLDLRARKLGVWNDEHGGFTPVPWVPDPGSAVRTFAANPEAFDRDAVGIVPGTVYGVRLDPDLAVTHNTAILGILGSGKTHLAWEVMKRLLLHGVKIVALDITGRYSRAFADLNAEANRLTFENRIEQLIAPTRNDNQVTDNEAGNVRTFSASVRAALRDWYDGECSLLVLNPLNFNVTKMEGRPTFQGTAVTLSRLTMVEVTRIIAEALLEIAIDADTASPNTEEEARIGIVLEEAHSLVPEWNAATSDAEKWAVNGSARAVLQGRKYGFGCLLVTQRTASVTKSILNQCNTIFALRAYDATGAGFLENYVGAGYAPLLATLKERQAIVFGRASSCSTPIVVRLNDADAFDQAVWTPGLGGLDHCEPTADETEHAEETEEIQPVDTPSHEDDDIPF